MPERPESARQADDSNSRILPLTPALSHQGRGRSVAGVVLAAGKSSRMGEFKPGMEVGDAAGFMVILGDQPGVRADTYIEVCQEWRRSGAKVVVARFGGRNGHPVLFDKSCGTEILELRPGQTLKDVVERHARAVE